MNEEVARLKQDVQAITGALGLDIWTRNDVRRGMLGDVAGGMAGLFLAAWNFRRGSPVAGLIVFLASLQAIVLLKAMGYAKHGEPSPGTRREVSFYNRYYSMGAIIIGCFYIWGAKLEIPIPLLLASSVIFCGLWYLLYAISAPSRSISLFGAVTLTLCRFILPAAADFSGMLCWLGIVTCVGCWLEAVALSAALRPNAAH
jgi:hypothetical protein